MPDAPYMFSAERIRKTFPVKDGGHCVALDALSLTVRAGGITALVGPDGAGKTTMLRLVAGLLRPDSGTFLWHGTPCAGRDETVQAHMGYMPQQFGLYEDLTVQENLDLYADLRGVGGTERAHRYRELLAMAALEPFRTRLAGKLSGGMKQKLGLICTLVSPPELLLLDEPTVGVDPLSRRELWDIIRRLAAASGMGVVVSTAYLDEAEACDEVVLLFEGKTLAAGTPESVRQHAEGMSRHALPAQGDTPRSLQARMLGAPGILDAVPQGGAVRFVHGPLTPDQEQNLAVLLDTAEVRTVPARLEDSFMVLLHSHAGKPEKTLSPPPAMEGRVREGGGEEEPVIQTQHVSRLFGDFVAVDDVSFSVRRGEVFGLLGPNGAGKTTTFRMLCGLLPASKGSLHVAGVDVREARAEARRRLGYVAQKFSLYGQLSVRENLDFFAGAYGIRGKARHARIRAVVDDFSLERYLDMPAERLPGGYKRRLAMAVALLHEPAILFLDEPTSGADPLARREFWKRISTLAEQGVTVVVTTHFMEEAEYCDRILIQDNGRMLALGNPAEIRGMAKPSSGPEPDMEDAFIAIVAAARATGRGKTP